MLDPSAAPPSSYLQYLPPMARGDEADPTRFLDRFLRIFEAILTGRPDAPPLRSVREGRFRIDLPYEERIDRLAEFFDPWQAPAAALPFLAARLGLPLEEDWDDHRKRRLIEGAVGIYQQRWLKRGLYTFFELYGATGARPRVVIDDGESLLAGRWHSEPGVEAIDLHAIAFARPAPPQGQPGSTERIGAALTHPTAVAVSPTAGEILVADAGPFDLPPLSPGVAQRRAALWLLSPDGRFLQWNTGLPAAPMPFNAGEPDPKLQDPIAALADDNGSYLVIDRPQPGKAVLYRYKAGQARKTELTAAQFGDVRPVDLVRRPAGGYYVLDQGNPSAMPAVPPRILQIGLAGPPLLQAFSLGVAVQTPTAMLVEQAGTVLVADAGLQLVPQNQTFPYPPELLQKLKGNLFRVTLGAAVTVVPLLADADQPDPPLVSPCALLPREPGKDGSVLLCDLGMKSGTAKDANNVSESFIRVMAEPTRLFRIDLAPEVRVTPVRLSLPLVNPVRLAWDGARLLLLDFGFLQNVSPGKVSEWRCEPHRFGVHVLFAATRPTRLPDRREVFQTLSRVLEAERPGHAIWSFQFAADAQAPPAPPDVEASALAGAPAGPPPVSPLLGDDERAPEDV